MFSPYHVWMILWLCCHKHNILQCWTLLLGIGKLGWIGTVKRRLHSAHALDTEFRVMPFGLCNEPSTFQRLMESVLMGLSRSRCMVYLDDVMVIGRNFTEHLENVWEVFERFRQANLKLKPEKCFLASSEVLYLGYVVVSREGISADVQKVEAVRSFPRLTNLTSLRSFLGLASYYQ